MCIKALLYSILVGTDYKSALASDQLKKRQERNIWTYENTCKNRQTNLKGNTSDGH